MCACSRVECPWAVNFGVVQPGGGPLTAVVGDAPQGLLLDWTTGKVILTLSLMCELLDWTTGSHRVVTLSPADPAAVVIAYIWQ